MKKAVLTVLADKLFLDQAKQLFSDAFWNAGWQGDYLLLAHEVDESDVQWFNEKGIIVKHCKALLSSDSKIDEILASKFYLFSEYFKKWEHVVYLDVDILIRGPLDGLLNVKGFAACHSLGQTVGDNLLPFNKIDGDLLDDLKSNFDLNANSCNSGVFVFNTEIIVEGMVQEILGIFIKYKKACRFHDQTTLNLFFCNRWQKLSPVYNRTIEKTEQGMIDPLKAEGIILHTVSLGVGPWNPDNTFYDEWKSNLNKAEQMNLSEIPNIKPWSQKEIERQSKKIIKNHIIGSKITFKK